MNLKTMYFSCVTDEHGAIIDVVNSVVVFATEPEVDRSFCVARKINGKTIITGKIKSITKSAETKYSRASMILTDYDDNKYMFYEMNENRPSTVEIRLFDEKTQEFKYHRLTVEQLEKLKEILPNLF